MALNFSNGLTIELTNALSSGSKGLNVIRLSKRPEDLTIAGSQTGAQYIIDGNLAVAGDKFRLNMSLINTTNSATIWSNIYERKMSASDIFQTQDELVRALAQEIVGTETGFSAIGRDITNNKTKGGTEKLSSFECVNFARAWSLDPESYPKIRKCLDLAIANDPNYADAWGQYGTSLYYAYAFYFTTDPKDLEAGITYINKAISLNPKNGAYLTTKAGLMFLKKNWIEMYAAIDKAVELSPNNVTVLGIGGYLSVWGGACTSAQLSDKNAKAGTYESGTCQWQKGYKLLLRAVELDKSNATTEKLYGLTSLYYRWGDYDKALKTVQLVPSPNFLWYHLWSGLSYEKLGDKESAAKSFESVQKILGSNNLAMLRSQFVMWNVDSSFWSLTEPTLIKYGFK